MEKLHSKLQTELQEAHKESENLATTLIELRAKLQAAQEDIEAQRKEKEMWKRKYNDLANGQGESGFRSESSPKSSAGGLQSQELELLKMLATEPWSGLLPRRVFVSHLSRSACDRFLC